MNSYNPHVSIVIPTRNRPSDLANCIASLAKQVDMSIPFEVIVVNDHSKPDLLTEYHHVLSNGNGLGIKFLSLPPNEKGAVFARNLGIQHAQGEIIAFLDDDSIPSENWIVILYEYFVKYPEIATITGKVEGVELDHPLSAFRQNFYNIRYNKLLQNGIKEQICRRFRLIAPKKLYVTDNMSGGNSAIRSSILQEAEGFDMKFLMMHDKELAIRLLQKQYICAFVPELEVKHVHTKSIRDAMLKAFHSGRYYYCLQQKHPSVLSNRIIQPLRPLEIIKASRELLFSLKKWKSPYLIMAIIMLEYLHQIGYLIELLLEWFQRVIYGGKDNGCTSG